MNKKIRIRESLVTPDGEQILFDTMHYTNGDRRILVKDPRRPHEHHDLFIDKDGKIGAVKTDETKKPGDPRRHVKNKETLSTLRNQILQHY